LLPSASAVWTVAERPGAPLDHAKCQAAWKMASSHGDVLSKARAAAYVLNFTVVDVNQDGEISEHEFKDAFPDCEVGAMPPFGNLYDMCVYADSALAEYEEITFTAGTHRELVRMSWEDMLRLVNPAVHELAYRPSAAAA